MVNDLGEVTGAVLLKGKTRELVKRHSSVMIPLMTSTDSDNPETSLADGRSAGADFGSDFSINNSSDSSGINANKKPRRKAALDSESHTRQILNMY